MRLSRHGKVVTSTVVRVAPDEFMMEAPYAMAVIETPEGARLMTQVVDCDPDTVGPGMDVNLVFRLIRKEDHGGILCYGHKAVPVGG
ncbi:MAG: OB-fold domain-containing protein [Gemmatimonadales bacterium]